MITVQAVVEVGARYEPAPWPVAPVAPWTWLPLTAASTLGEAALFVASLAGDIDALLAEELLIAVGGLRLHDTATGVTIVPGCCAGLEDWRDWVGVLSGDASLWLGHDPTPCVRFVDDQIRVSQDDRSRTYVGVPRPAMAALLEGVHRDLTGFLDVVRAWAHEAGYGDRADAISAVIDRDFAITAPLHLPV